MDMVKLRIVNSGKLRELRGLRYLKNLIDLRVLRNYKVLKNEAPLPGSTGVPRSLPHVGTNMLTENPTVETRNVI